MTDPSLRSMTPEEIVTATVRGWYSDPAALATDLTRNYAALRNFVAWAIEEDRRQQDEWRRPLPKPTAEDRADEVVSEWLAGDVRDEARLAFPRLRELMVKAVYADRSARAPAARAAELASA